MKIPVLGIAKLKVPKESTGRALANCASGKYRSSPIKLTSLDMSLEQPVSSKVMLLQVLQDQMLPVGVNSLSASARLFLSCERMEKIGSEVALWQVPTRPFCAAGSYLHAKLAWHLGIVCRSPGIIVFVEARSLVSDAPTWNKRSSELLVVTRGYIVRSSEG